MLLVPSLSWGNHLDTKDELSIQNLIDESLTCFSFYLTTAEGFKRNDPNDSSGGIAKANQNAELLINFATKFKELAHIKEEAIMTKLKLINDNIQNDMDGHFSNFSIILDKYGQSCANFVLAIEELTK